MSKICAFISKCWHLRMNLNKQKGLYFFLLQSLDTIKRLHLKTGGGKKWAPSIALFLLSETQSGWINPKYSQNFPNNFWINLNLQWVYLHAYPAQIPPSKGKGLKFLCGEKGFCTTFNTQWKSSVWTLCRHYFDNFIWDPHLDPLLWRQTFLKPEGTLSCWPQ